VTRIHRHSRSVGVTWAAPGKRPSSLSCEISSHRISRPGSTIRATRHSAPGRENRSRADRPAAGHTIDLKNPRGAARIFCCPQICGLARCHGIFGVARRRNG
jgi:hypothetical protein